MTLRRRVRRFVALFRKKELERELREEMAVHIELAEREALDRGLSPAEARRQALVEFGGVEAMREAHREQRSALWAENALLDVRYAVASLRRNPSFFLVVVGVLALGIGANVAMFSLYDQVLLRSLPFPEPERMVRVWKEPVPGAINVTATLDFEDWKRLSGSFEALSVQNDSTVAFTGEGDPVRLQGRFVSSDYFKVFGVSPAMGRDFLPEEDQPGAAPVVLLSHSSWQSQFGGDAEILGRELILDGVANRVIGVLPPGPFDREKAVFWKPLVFTPEQRTRGYMWLAVVGRLKEGVTLAAAQEEMSRLDVDVSTLAPFWRRDWGVTVEPFETRVVGGQMARAIQVALGAVGLVLLLACANVTNLLLARGAARRKELMLRTALGASRVRVLTQLLTEGLVLCVAGGAVGVALAFSLIRAAQPMLADSLPPTSSLALDWRALAFAFLVIPGCSLLVSLFPSLHAIGKSSARSIALSTRNERSGVRSAIVVLEVAGSLILVCGALLLLKSLFQLQQEDAGFQLDNLVTMSFSLPVSTYPTAESAASLAERLVVEVQSVPGAEAAAMTTDLPLRGVGEGQALLHEEAGISVRFKRIDPAYLDTLGIELISGRDFDFADVSGAPRVALINEELAQALKEEAGVENAIERSFRVSTPFYVRKDGALVDTRVVGLIRSELLIAGGVRNEPTVYVPFAQVPARGLNLLVRTRLPPSDIAMSVRAAVARLDPDLALGELSTIQQVKQRQLSLPSQAAVIVGAFAAVAMLLAAMGLYGVLSYAVAQQGHEIGIRMALGARATTVISQVLRSALGIVGLGLILGVAGAVAFGRILESLLFEVSTLDPTALVGAVGCMAVVGLLAGLIPATRAAQVDPITVLRDDV